MNQTILERKLLSMVEEDQGAGDITSDLLEDQDATAEVVAKESCVISGVSEVSSLFSLFGISVLSSAPEGSIVQPDQRVFIISGEAKKILLVERTALNILSRMSGITSLTREYVKAARKENPKVRVAATRKTTPFFGYFEKKAVSVGGGDPHRSGLYDMVLIKDNHMKFFSSVAEAVKVARQKNSFSRKIEIEVTSVEDAVSAAEAGADIVMLDNMPPSEVAAAIEALKEKDLRKKILIESSGGISLENISDYAKAGADIISVGKLTHSAPSKDFSLTIL